MVRLGVGEVGTRKERSLSTIDDDVVDVLLSAYLIYNMMDLNQCPMIHLLERADK